jgi:hypothetical protein
LVFEKEIIRMYKRTSQAQQDRERALAASAPTNGGIEASEAFKVGEESILETELRIVQGDIREINQRLAECNLRRLDKKHPDRLRLVVRQQELQAQVAILKPRVKVERMRISNDRSAEYQRTFMETAREMLATPVYERILNATLHKLGR